jgi:L-lactate utilization protein LutC
VERSGFIEVVRRRLEGVAAPDLPSDLPPTFATGDGRLFDRFAAELDLAGGEVARVGPDELSAQVAARASGCASAVVAPALDHREAVLEGLARAGCELLEPDREGAARAEIGITGAVLAVASTGSVLLAAAPDAARAVGLLPPFHLVVLPEDRIVPGFEDLFEQVPALAGRSSQLVLLTGPSRTADIEMTLVRGVHGPGRLAVLVVAA